MPAKSDRPILDAVLHTSEVITDVIMRGEVLSDIPVIGTAFKVCKGTDAVRDRAFLAKLSLFASGLDAVSDSTKLKMKEKLAALPEEAKKIGESLFLVLDRLTDLDKSSLLATIFLTYIDGAITPTDLRRLSQAIDAAFADDLAELLNREELPTKSDEPWMLYLASSGLTRVFGGKTWADLGQVYLEVSPLGHLLRSAYFHGRRLQG